jgi:predicted nuclease with TOPRIM domain
MYERLQTRLAQLKGEYEAGQQMLAELEQKQRNLRETLLRISGAIQVLEEELGQVTPEPNKATSNGAQAPAGDFAP